MTEVLFARLDEVQEIIDLAVDDLIDAGTFLISANNLSDVIVPATARTNLGLAIGTDVQAFDADLTTLAALASTGYLARTGSATYALRTFAEGLGVDLTNADGVAGNTTISLDFTEFATVTPVAVDDFLVFADASTGVQGKALIQTVLNLAGSGVTSFNASSGAVVFGTGGALVNNGLGAVAGSNDLVVSLLDAAGSAPSAGSPVVGVFRSATLTSGTMSTVSRTSALSLTIPNGATLGSLNSTPFQVLVAWVRDGSTDRLAVMNASSSSGIRSVEGSGILSATSIDTGADSAFTWYSDATVTAKPYVVIGRFVYGSTTLATAGTYASSPTMLEPAHKDFRMPGSIIQSYTTSAGTYLSAGTTLVPRDNTIPQVSETNAIYTRTITPTNHANWLNVYSQINAEYSAASWVIAALFRDAGTNALNVSADFITGASTGRALNVSTSVLVTSLSGTTFRVNGAGVNAGTFSVNGDSGATVWGVAEISYLTVEEQQG